MFSRPFPKILTVKSEAKSKLFTIESLDLRFSNGVKRTYERMKPANHRSVMVVPITEEGDVLLIREYSVGTERYELGFPKGRVDSKESLEQAAVRELKEEVGLGTYKLTYLREVVLAPSFLSSHMTLFTAQGLYPEVLKGDEPEPLEICRYPLSESFKLLSRPDFRESRSILALLLTLRKLDDLLDVGSASFSGTEG